MNCLSFFLDPFGVQILGLKRVDLTPYRVPLYCFSKKCQNNYRERVRMREIDREREREEERERKRERKKKRGREREGGREREREILFGCKV